jgi:predicted nucleic acid-binding protein
MILVDANIILDIWNPNPIWDVWSIGQLQKLSILHELAINPIIYSEISVSFKTPFSLDKRLNDMQIGVLSIPLHAAFLAGKAHQQYRRRSGTKGKVLSDFLIGAHAAVLACALLTRDTRIYSTYFPTVPLIAP